MNELLGSLPGIGKLFINYPLCVYDGESLSDLCINQRQQKFITVAIGPQEEDEWLLVQISDGKLIKMIKDEISWRSVFGEPEEGFVWKIKRLQGGGITPRVIYSTAEIPEKLLPVGNAPLRMGEEDIKICLQNIEQINSVEKEAGLILTRMETKHSDIKDDIAALKKLLPILSS